MRVTIRRRNKPILAASRPCMSIHQLSLVGGFAELAAPGFGAYVPALEIASSGVPRHPRPALLHCRELALERLELMGDSRVCILRGHGLVAMGESIEEAVANALRVNRLAEIALDLGRIGSLRQREIAAGDGRLAGPWGQGSRFRFLAASRQCADPLVQWSYALSSG